MTCVPSLHPSGFSSGTHPPLWLRCILCVPKALCAGFQPSPWLGTPGVGANMVLILRCREPPNQTCCSPRRSCPFHEGHSRPGALTRSLGHDSRKQGPRCSGPTPSLTSLSFQFEILPKSAPKISDSFTSYHNPSFSTRSRSLAGTEPARSGREALAPDTGEKVLVGKASKLHLGTQTHAVGTWAVRPQGYNIQDCSLSFGGRLFPFYNWKTKLAESKNTCIGMQELVIPGETGQAVVAVKPACQEGTPRDLGSRFQSKGQSGSHEKSGNQR